MAPEIENQIQTFRARHELRPLASAEEGMPLGELPSKVFGYTYSPLNSSTPLFARRTFQCFEVHKLDEERANVVCFVTRQEADAIQSGGEIVELKLYPEPAGDSTALVEVNVARIAKAKMPSRSNGNYMPVHLDSDP